MFRPIALACFVIALLTISVSGLAVFGGSYAQWFTGAFMAWLISDIAPGLISVPVEWLRRRNAAPVVRAQ